MAGMKSRSPGQVKEEITAANPLITEDVMTVFRKHGITGNPVLQLEEAADELPLLERRIEVESQ